MPACQATLRVHFPQVSENLTGLGICLLVESVVVTVSGNRPHHDSQSCGRLEKCALAVVIGVVVVVA